MPRQWTIQPSHGSFRGQWSDGQFYHRSFARIGFTPEQADDVSSIELLHVPTTGRNRIDLTDLAEAHPARIADSIEKGRPQHVFVPSGVARLKTASSCFPWLSTRSIDTAGGLDVLARVRDKTVYAHLHFSVYGKFEARKSEEARAIAGLVARVPPATAGGTAQPDDRSK